MSRLNRNITIISSVLLLHVLVLWAMQTGLLRRMAEAVVPAEILVEIMAAPAAIPAPEPAQQPQPKVLAKAPTPQPVQPTPAPAATPQPSPAPLAIAPSAAAPAATAAAPTAATATPATANTGSGVSATPAPARVELPSSTASHLNNPPAVYPRASVSSRETGTVTLLILVGADGLTKDVRIEKSSGFDRLDKAAFDKVWVWKFVPGKRDGVPVEMWMKQPIPFILQQ